MDSERVDKSPYGKYCIWSISLDGAIDYGSYLGSSSYSIEEMSCNNMFWSHDGIYLRYLFFLYSHIDPVHLDKSYDAGR